MTENRAALLAEIAANIPDNTSGEVTPADIRQTLLDIVSNIATLLDAQAFAAVQTFSVPPIMTGLTGILLGGGTAAISALTAAAVQAIVGPGSLAFTAKTVNLNALADTPIAIALPAGFTRYKVSGVHVSNASVSLTTAQFGLYTAVAQGGVNIVAQTLTGITSTATDTNPNAYSATILDAGTRSYNDATLYFNVGTAQGAVASADVTIIITPLP